MDTKNLTIGERIRYRRKNLKYTQRSLAKALKISHVSVSQWERDDSEPTGKNLFALSNVLQCSPTWILFGDEDKQPSPPIEIQLLYPPKNTSSLNFLMHCLNQNRTLSSPRCAPIEKISTNSLKTYLKARRRTNKR
ncbi:helix-turn-helix domain-containing protein [Escherichia coli]